MQSKYVVQNLLGLQTEFVETSPEYFNLNRLFNVGERYPREFESV